jgi:hypothetical protein
LKELLGRSIFSGAVAASKKNVFTAQVHGFAGFYILPGAAVLCRVLPYNPSICCSTGSGYLQKCPWQHAVFENIF